MSPIDNKNQFSALTPESKNLNNKNYNFKNISRLFFIDRLLEVIKKIALAFFGFFKNCSLVFEREKRVRKINSPTSSKFPKISLVVPMEIEKPHDFIKNSSSFSLPLPKTPVKEASPTLNPKVENPVPQKNGLMQADKVGEKNEGCPDASMQPVKNVEKNELNLFLSNDLFFKKNEDEVTWEAVDFITRPDIQKKKIGSVPNISLLGPQASDHALIDAMLENHRGFCVGESHIDPSGKKFFIENMPYFKEKGVKVLFIEGIPYQSQNLIDTYMRLPNPPLSSNLFWGVSPAPNDPRYQDYLVMEAAKKYGIRVVVMDLSMNQNYVYSSPNRLLTMNYYCYKVMQKELLQLNKEDKYIGFMGARHLVKQRDVPLVPGVANLMECPAIYAVQNPINKRQVEYDSCVETSSEDLTFTLQTEIPPSLSTV